MKIKNDNVELSDIKKMISHFYQNGEECSMEFLHQDGKIRKYHSTNEKEMDEIKHVYCAWFDDPNGK